MSPENVLTETGRTLFVMEADGSPMLMVTAIPAAHATSGEMSCESPCTQDPYWAKVNSTSSRPR